jgi:lipopolysaccharide biosynthesis glycosyltransferase
MYADNTGDSISSRNKSFCELTAQYWAWKNIDADYYGFCHYRRLFSFSPTPLNRTQEFGVFSYAYLNNKALTQLCWDEESIVQAVDGYDFIIAKGIPTGDLYARTVLEHWKHAEELPDADLDCMLAIIKERHPSLYGPTLHYIKGSVFYPCNMFIISKALMELFFPILFDVLDEYERRTDMSRYSIQTLRTTGHLAERLVGIYFSYISQSGNYRTKELEIAYFENTTSVVFPEPSSIDALPIVFSSSDEFVPYLDICLSSLYAHASRHRRYDIVVLTTDITRQNQYVLSQQASMHDNIRLSFVDVGPLLDDRTLSTKGIIDHVPVQTFYRFFILDVMHAYQKVLYLDSDMLIQDDVAKLFDEEIGDSMIGAVVDADYLSHLNFGRVSKTKEAHGDNRYEYTKKVLGLEDPYQYFQAGVLLFNLPAIQERYSSDDLVSMALSQQYIYLDQDILNKICAGRVHYFDMSWNVLIDHHFGDGRLNIIKKWAPANIANEYLDSRSRPRIIHYAGAQKPWANPNTDYGLEFWKQAKTSPYYEEIFIRSSAVPPAQPTHSRLRRVLKLFRQTAQNLKYMGIRKTFSLVRDYFDRRKNLNIF